MTEGVQGTAAVTSESAMLGKLRRKFIALIMVAVAIVLAIAFTAICYTDYQRDKSELDEAMVSSLEFVERDLDIFIGGAGGPWDGPEGLMGEKPDGKGQYGPGPAIGGNDERRSLTPIAVCRVNEDGSFAVVSSATTASMSDNVLEQASIEFAAIEKTSEGTGEFSELGLVYHYRVTKVGTAVAFADIGAVGGWKQLAATLSLVGIAVLLVFFIVSLFFSRWALKPVAEAWRKQRQFVADASHELKTPLTVILANTSILLRHPQESIASQSQWLESTQLEGERMQELVGDMLTLAQVEATGAASHEPVDFSDVVDGMVLQFESVAFERGVGVQADVAQGITVAGDRGQLEKLVRTLIDNACKYAAGSGGVDVALAAQGQRAVLTVRNDGPEISAEDLAHVFDRFYRSDKARTSSEGGFGLGLAIAKEIAEEHGGTIAVSSDSVHGTTFTVELPTA